MHLFIASDYLKVTVYNRKAQYILIFVNSSKKIVWGGRASSFFQWSCWYLISSVCAPCVTNYSLFAPNVKALQQS